MNCVKTTAIEVNGNSLVLTVSPMELTNGKKIKVCMIQDIPCFNDILNVVVKVGKTAYTVITRCVPNNLYTDQLKHCCNGKLKSRQAIDIVFATDTKCFLYDGLKLPCTKHNMCIIPKDYEVEEPR